VQLTSTHKNITANFQVTMRPEISGDLDDSGAEEIGNLVQFDGKNMHLPFLIYSAFHLNNSI